MTGELGLTRETLDALLRPAMDERDIAIREVLYRDVLAERSQRPARSNARHRRNGARARR